MRLRRPGEKRRPLPPRVLIATDLFLIAVGLVWPRATFLHGAMSADGVDLIQGFLFGMAIAFGVMGVGVMVRGRGDSSTVPRD